MSYSSLKCCVLVEVNLAFSKVCCGKNKQRCVRHSDSSVLFILEIILFLPSRRAKPLFETGLDESTVALQTLHRCGPDFTEKFGDVHYKR